MSYLFGDAREFNQPLDNWDVSSATDMRGSFLDATKFNQPLNSWETGAVSYMGGVFSRAASFNQALSNWDVAAVTDMTAFVCDCGCLQSASEQLDRF